MLSDQVIQKGDEVITIALFRNLLNDLIGNPIVGAKDMPPWLLPWGRNPFLTASFHPAGHQNGQQT